MDDFVPSLAQPCIGPEWNSMERYAEGRTALLHYTDMHRQPWVSCANPLGHLWVASLRQAMSAGAITRQEVARHVAAGHVRPSLLAQLDRGLDDGMLLPGADRRQDGGFRAPFRSLAPVRISWGQGRLMWLRAVLRRRWAANWLRRLRRRMGQMGASSRLQG